ncbi:hypothetical protein TcasGA2_TC005422 [Tribolium castaneum]|uniref:Uncharacterized protein n=1 Tax=Tribolium castaneum TaxID=7070 RepID=D6WYW9_TRICA|nr:hypothetical protein TcasGA2_TC005422 [Tribolium castaneum]
MRPSAVLAPEISGTFSMKVSQKRKPISRSFRESPVAAFILRKSGIFAPDYVRRAVMDAVIGYTTIVHIPTPITLSLRPKALTFHFRRLRATAKITHTVNTQNGGKLMRELREIQNEAFSDRENY